MTCLNGEKLNAFHVAAKYGNVAAIRFFMDVKGIHPAKASDNGQTPLQLAIAAPSIADDMDAVVELVEVLVKPAPVHDVAKCYAAVETELANPDGAKKQTYAKIKDALLKKVHMQFD